MACDTRIIILLRPNTNAMARAAVEYGGLLLDTVELALTRCTAMIAALTGGS